MSKEEPEVDPAFPPPQPGGRRVSWANTAAVATINSEQAPATVVSKFRTALPQVLASSVKNLLLLDLGMVVAFPTILIPSIQNVEAAGPLNLNNEQTSWIGSIAYICQPLGSVLSGALLEPLGRKRSMLLVNAPLLAGWLLFYCANSPTTLYAANCVLGLSVGFMEASVITYVGEISQPSLRGMLTSYAEVCVSVGFFLEYLLGTITDWRNAALISALLPVLSALLITQVPETPIWLVTRGRQKDAERALCWLRGWVPSANVQQELSELCRYHKQSQAAETAPARPPPTATSTASPDSATAPAAASGDATAPAGGRHQRRRSSASDLLTPAEEEAAILAALHERHRASQHFPVGLPAFVEQPKQVDDPDDDDEIAAWCESAPCRKLTALLGPSTIKPMLVVLIYFTFQCWSATTGARAYTVQICDKFGMPIDSHWATVTTGAIGIAGNVLCMVAVRWCGKRPLSLLSLGAGALCCVLLAAYAQARAGLAPGEELAVGNWAPLVLFVLLFLSWAFGAGPIPWMLLSEVFPYRTRGLASGITAALSYVIAFSAAKTYLDLEEKLGLYGVFYLYAAVSAAGCVFLYFAMAETEGRTLEDIEKHYSGPQSEQPPVQPPPALRKPRDTNGSASQHPNGDCSRSKEDKCKNASTKENVDTPETNSSTNDTETKTSIPVELTENAAVIDDSCEVSGGGNVSQPEIKSSRSLPDNTSGNGIEERLEMIAQKSVPGINGSNVSNKTIDKENKKIATAEDLKESAGTSDSIAKENLENIHTETESVLQQPNVDGDTIVEAREVPQDAEPFHAENATLKQTGNNTHVKNPESDLTKNKTGHSENSMDCDGSITISHDLEAVPNSTPINDATICNGVQKSHSTPNGSAENQNAETEATKFNGTESLKEINGIKDILADHFPEKREDLITKI